MGVAITAALLSGSGHARVDVPGGRVCPQGVVSVTGRCRWLGVCAWHEATVNESFPKVLRNLFGTCLSGRRNVSATCMSGSVSPCCAAAQPLDATSAGPYGRESSRNAFRTCRNYGVLQRCSMSTAAAAPLTGTPRANRQTASASPARRPNRMAGCAGRRSSGPRPLGRAPPSPQPPRTLPPMAHGTGRHAGGLLTDRFRGFGSKPSPPADHRARGRLSRLVPHFARATHPTGGRQRCQRAALSAFEQVRR